LLFCQSYGYLHAEVNYGISYVGHFFGLDRLGWYAGSSDACVWGRVIYATLDTKPVDRAPRRNVSEDTPHRLLESRSSVTHITPLYHRPFGRLKANT
jgi:hypothetical protein